MVALSPTPDSLGLASPALGPWFHTEGAGTLPNLDIPGANLSVGVSLANDMQWRAPAGCLVSYFIATDPRPAGLAMLRQENGAPAFATGEVIVLLSLLPEVELRLQALMTVIPSPDGTAVAAGIPSRPRVRFLAMAVAATDLPDVTALENIRPADFPVVINSDADKAAYLGLTFEAGVFGNADKPTTELRRPATDSAVIVENRRGTALGMSLWAFDYRGRPLDPGAVASWWSHLASPGVFDNLWAHDDVSLQRTVPAVSSNSVHLVNAHEGALSAAHLARLDLTGLTQRSGSTALFTVGNPASLSLTTAPTPDDAPLPRLALLPHTNYAEPTSRGASLFSGWNSSTTPWPTSLGRDFVRIALLDMESHLVGLTRTNALQAEARTRINVLRNAAVTPFLARTDSASQQLLDVLRGGNNAMAMAPLMDSHWGALVQGSFGTDDLPDTLNFDVKALRGEGSNDGGTVSNQRIVLHFPDGSLPAGAWIRCWPHGLDTDTGTRFRQDGGGAKADSAGEAFLVMAIPDGTAAPVDPSAAPVRLSFDALVVTDETARYYVEQRYSRPSVLAGARIALPASPGLPAATTLWICEQGQAMARAANSYGAGQTLLGLPDDRDSGAYALVDLASLADADVSANTLRNSVDSTDTLIVTKPAFQTTAEGDVNASPGPGGSTVVHRDRNAFTQIDGLGQPAPLMERREVMAVDVANASGVVGATPGRASLHEASPVQQGHPGMPATAEVHGSGMALTGPAITPLTQMMRERVATGLGNFVSVAQTPISAIADPGGTTSFTAVLETMTFGVAGDALLRTFIEASPSFTPGQDWVSLKNAIESATGIDLDPFIDTGTLDDDTLAAALDRMILKTKDGLFQAATALQSAIARAEDFIYIETPAIDPLSAGSTASIDFISAITDRWIERPSLKVIICVPERFLPGQPKKLELIRQAGVAAAMKALQEASPENVALFTPVAGSGRRMHMASTTVIIDDVFALTGSTHLWRRGLSFDSSVAVSLFDENVVDGRSAAIRNARRQLFIERLGLAVGLAPDDPSDMLAAVRSLNTVGGLQRVKPNVYPAAEDPTTPTDRDIWNPDGRPGTVTDWFLFFGSLTGDVADEVNNATR